jgi:hypothetical protein
MNVTISLRMIGRSYYLVISDTQGNLITEIPVSYEQYYDELMNAGVKEEK